MFQRCAIAALAVVAAVFPAVAAPLGPSSGFLASYTGPHNADLDLQSAEAFFDGTNFTFDATVKGPVGTTPGGAYVWGINRGSNTAGFGAFAPGVLFDAVVVFFGGGGGGLVVDFAHGGTQTPIPAADVTISGDNIDGFVPGADLPTIGLFSPSQYQVNLWPRSGLDATMNNQIAEFDPANSDVPVTATPEPASMGLLGLGLAGLGLLARRVRG